MPRSDERAVFYVHDSFGLGNLRRMFALASAYARRSGTRCLVVSGSEFSDFFVNEAERVDRVKLPSLGRDADGRSTTRLDDLARVRLLRARMLEALFAEFQPT